MKKFQIIKAVVDFAESCEANGVQLFFDYAPHCDFVRVYVNTGGKWSPDSEIEYLERIEFNEPDPYLKLKLIIETVIDRYYATK